MAQNMGIPARKYFYFWLIVFFLLFGFLWLFSDVLFPFVAGMVLAYFLDPVADRLEKAGLSRMMSTTVITVCFILVFILFLRIIVPVLVNQTSAFLDSLPTLVDKLQNLIASSKDTKLYKALGMEGETLTEHSGDILAQASKWISKILGSIWRSGASIANVLSLMVITPVVAFYMLLDWDNIVAQVDDLLPHRSKATIEDVARDINTSVAGFVRGQGMVCLCLGIFYATCLTLLDVNFGLLIGLFTGFISFIPYVGSMIGFVLSVGVALVQFWPDLGPIIATAAVFFAGQFIEGYVLQPKLVGKRIGLHPVWMMFALIAFGSLYGFTGLLIAVPVSAAIAVVIRHIIASYKQSDLYLGTGEPVPADSKPATKSTPKPTSKARAGKKKAPKTS